MSSKPTQKEYEQAKNAGGSARRAGRGIDTCPRYGNGEAAQIMAEAWRNEWTRVDNERRKA